MAWISNHKHEIEEKSTKISRSSSKVVGIRLVDLWEFPTLILIESSKISIASFLINEFFQYFAQS